MIVTIDGPSGAGKSSAAKSLAQRLGFAYLDTGAMYRVVTLAGMRQGCDFSDLNHVRELLETLQIEMPPGQVTLNGEDVTSLIRTPAVTEASAKAASCVLVRRKLVRLQRDIAAGQDIICEGRDQGTIVFPDADCKFFLIAAPEKRALRRFQELTRYGEAVSLPEVLKSQEARDQRDAERDLAPMLPAPDAVLIDNSSLSLVQVVDLMEQLVRQCERGLPGFGTNSIA